MRFARVVGVVRPVVDGEGAGTGLLDLVVTLDSGSRVETVRSERVPVLPVPNGVEELPWLADQFTQETIGNELALDGWEVVGVAPDERDRDTAATLTGSSPMYVVRHI